MPLYLKCHSNILLSHILNIFPLKGSYKSKWAVNRPHSGPLMLYPRKTVIYVIQNGQMNATATSIIIERSVSNRFLFQPSPKTKQFYVNISKNGPNRNLIGEKCIGNWLYSYYNFRHKDRTSCWSLFHVFYE